MKARRLLLAAMSLLTVLMLPGTRIAAAPPTPTVVEGVGTLSDGDGNKFPDAAIGGGRVYIGWSDSNPDSANLSERAEEPSGPFAVSSLGQVGNSIYNGTAVSVGADGTVHYAWTQNSQFIRYRSRQPGQNWSATRTVFGSANFANAMDMAVRGSNEIFILWRERTGGLSFAYSPDKGANWPIVTSISLLFDSYSGRPRIASAGNKVFASWAAEGRIFLGEWNGQTFAVSCVTCATYGDANTGFFQPDVAVGTDGTPYVAFYRPGGGVYYGYRQNGTWTLPRISGDAGVPPSGVAIDVDSRNNVHIVWDAKDSSTPGIKYIVKAPTEANFSSPIVISGDTYAPNLDIAASVKPSYTQAHIVWESYATGGSRIRYARVQANGIGCSPTLTRNTATQPNVSTNARTTLYFPLFFKSPPQPTGCS